MANEYDDIIDQQVGSERASLQQSMFAVKDQEPDRQAQVLKLSQASSLPPQVVDRNFDQVKATHEQSGFDYDGLMAKTPQLASWMKDPQNAGVAKDDTAALGQVENTVQDHGLMTTVYNAVAKETSSLLAGAAQIPAMDVDMLLWKQHLGAWLSGHPENELKAPDWLRNNPATQYFHKAAKEYADQEPALSMNIIDEARAGNYKRAGLAMAAQLAAAVPQVAAVTAGTLAGAGPAALLMTGGAVGAEAEGDALDQGVTPLQATASGALKAGIAVGTGHVFTLKVLKGWGDALTRAVGKPVAAEVAKDFGKTLMYSVFNEGNMNAVMDGSNHLADYMTGVNDNAFDNFAKDAAQAWIVGGALGGTLMPIGGIGAAAGRMELVRRAQMNKDFYTALGNTAEATKLRQRMPEAQRSLVEQMIKDSPVENVYISPEAIKQHFDQSGQNPVKAIQQIGLTEEYQKALDTGLDLRIPLAEWTDKVAGTQHYEAFANDVKFSPDALSVNEAKAEHDKVEAQRQAVQAEADAAAQAQAEGEANDAHNEQVDQLKSVIADQLVKTGRHDEQTAKNFAELYGERLKRRSELTGQTPEELAQRQNLSIERADRITASEGLNQNAADAIQPAEGDTPEIASAKQLLQQIDTPEKATALTGEDRAMYLAALDTIYGNREARAEQLGIKPLRVSVEGSRDPGTSDFNLLAHRGDEPAGKMNVWHDGDSVFAYHVEVSPQFRRQGVATELYDEAARASGKPIRPSTEQTPEAAAFWENRLTNVRLEPDLDPRFDKSPLLLAQVGREWQTNVPMPDQVQVTQADADVGSMQDVRAQAKDLYEGKSFTNAQTGWDVQMTNVGLKKAWKTLGSEANRLAMMNLDQLIENGVLARSEEDKGGHNEKLHVFYAPMSSATSDYLVRLVVREAEGKQFYDKFAVIKETSRPAIQDELGTEAAGEEPGVSTVDDRTDLRQSKSEVGDASTTAPAEIARPSTIPIDQFIAENNERMRSDPYWQDARGQIQLGQGDVKILLGPDTDRSTFLHETGHLWLHEIGQDISFLTKLDPDTLNTSQRQFLKDTDTILDWLKAPSFDKLTTEQHEQWARGAEAYFMEGKAPSQKLAQVFQRFRQWLTGIYRSVKGLNVDLNDDVRQVFDRLIASDEAIAQAKEKLDTPVLFSDPRRMGMSEAKTYEYLNAQTHAQLESERELDQRLMAELKRQQTKVYEEQRAKIEELVRQELAQKPEQIAKSVLQRGKLPDGSDLPDGMEKIKISRKSLVEAVGEKELKQLPKPHVFSRDGGVSLETAAEMFGFRSGQELIESLKTAPKFDEAVRTETETRMKAEHGDLLTDGRMPDEALKAIHNEKRAALLKRELEILMSENLPVFKEVVRRVSRPIPKIEEVRAQAEKVIGSTAIKDIKPIAFDRAQSKLAKAAVEHMLKGDLNAAFEAKTKELLNHELHRAATRALDFADKTADYMKKFQRESKRQQLGRTDYLSQIDSILSRFQFANVSDKELNRREKTLAEFIEAKQRNGDSAGEEVYAPDFVKDEAIAKNYRQLTYDEMTGVRDLVKQIEHMAIQSDKMLAQEKRIKRAEVRDDLIASLRANLEKKPPRAFTKEGQTRRDRIAKTVAQFDSSMIKMEQVIHWLDGGDITGPWHEYLWHRASDAQNAEYDYTAKVTAKIAKLVMGMPKELRERMSEPVEVPGIERKMVRRDLLGVALNVGNEGNYRKLLEGHGWSEDTVRTMLDHLTEPEWKFVQGAWDTLKEMWPDIAKLQREITGLEPDKIDIRPVTTKYGTFEGGYYPLIYDSIASEQGALQLSTRAGGLVEDAYTRATTPKGHTKSRVDGFSAPIDLDLDNLPSHIAGVVKDLTHRKWLIDANFIVNDRDIRGALADHLGPEYVPMFQDWVKQIVNDRNSPNTKSLSVWRRMVDATRFNATVAAMGFKVTTLLAQFGDFAVAMEHVGGKELDGHQWMLHGMSKFISHPLDTFHTVTEKSGEMRHRLETKDRELRDKLRLLEGKEDIMSHVQEAALHGIGYVEMTVALPTWMAGYEKAISQGLSEDHAIRSGDKAVRLSFGSAGAKDLAGVMSRNDTFMRVMTMFYTPFSALYSRLRTIGHDFDGIKSVPQLAARTFLVWTVAATMGELVAGKGPASDADEDDWFKWWMKTQALYPFMAVPMLRDVVSGVFSDFGYTFSPLAQAGSTTVDAIKTAKKYYDGDKDMEDLAKKTLKASGFWLGVPAGQLDITGSYLLDLYHGNESPQSLGEFAHHMIMRRDKQ